MYSHCDAGPYGGKDPGAKGEYRVPMMGAEEPTMGALIVYLNDGVSQSRTNQCAQKLYGQMASSRGRKYWRKGLLENLPHWCVKRGVILVRHEDRTQVMRVLSGVAKQAYWWPVRLSSRDLKQMRRRRKMHGRNSGGRGTPRS